MNNPTLLKNASLPPVPGAVHEGRASADASLSVTLVLHPPQSWHSHMREGSPGPRLPQQFVDYQRFASTLGSPPEDIATVEAWLRKQGLQVGKASPALHLVRASGTVAQMEAAFGVELHNHRLAAHRYLHQHGDIRLPAAIAARVQTVLGLDTRPAGRRVVHAVQSHGGGVAGSPSGSGPLPSTYNPTQIAQLYAFPQASGNGRRIALIEFGGGYSLPLLDTAFQTLIGGPPPQLTDSCIMGAQNIMYSTNYVEVLLDIQVAGAVAPKADYLIVFAPNEFQAWVNALDAALSWQGGPPDAISISWGAPENSWPAATISALEQAFQSAAAMGVTVITTSGDSGVTLGSTAPQVEYPASSQHVLSCGGTYLAQVNRNSPPVIVNEVVWNDSSGATGGGISQVVPVPAWQQGVTLPPSLSPGGKPGRGLPDLGGNASALSGYSIMVAPDTWISGMGTSAVAPLYAALIAQLAQARGQPLGFVNPTLYAHAAANKLVVEIVSGNNGNNGVAGYSAGPGWNACTGLGRVNGSGWSALFGTKAP